MLAILWLDGFYSGRSGLTELPAGWVRTISQGLGGGNDGGFADTSRWAEFRAGIFALRVPPAVRKGIAAMTSVRTRRDSVSSPYFRPRREVSRKSNDNLSD